MELVNEHIEKTAQYEPVVQRDVKIIVAIAPEAF